MRNDIGRLSPHSGGWDTDMSDVARFFGADADLLNPLGVQVGGPARGVKLADRAERRRVLWKVKPWACAS